MAAMTAAAETMQDTTAAPVLELAADLSPAVTALERAWRMIQAQFPGTPAATLVVKRDQFAWGHTTVAKTWAASTVDATDEASHFEVMISGENLRRGARFVAATLLHESAHAANLAAGKLDTDSNGRHSRVFADEAEARGLVVTQAGWRGWTGTELPEDVATTGGPGGPQHQPPAEAPAPAGRRRRRRGRHPGDPAPGGPGGPPEAGEPEPAGGHLRLRHEDPGQPGGAGHLPADLPGLHGAVPGRVTRITRGSWLKPGSPW
jgi:hypothetical protein